jgi:predicted acetyltransferase
MSLDKFPILFVMIITRQITRTSLDAGVADSVAVERFSKQDTGDEKQQKEKSGSFEPLTKRQGREGRSQGRRCKMSSGLTPRCSLMKSWKAWDRVEVI